VRSRRPLPFVLFRSTAFGTLAFFKTAVPVGIVIGTGRPAEEQDRPNFVLPAVADTSVPTSVPEKVGGVR
jgi:hypothetical protein